MAKRGQGQGDEPPDDHVGYCHPPKEHRFKNGHSGNPWGCKGKPRQKRDFLDERQRVRIEGRSKWLTRSELVDHALYKAVVTDGNVAAAKLLDARQQARMARRAEGVDADLLSEEEEVALLRAAERRLRRHDRKAGENDPDADPDDDAGQEDDR